MFPKFPENENVQKVPEHLACLIETVSSSLSSNQKQQVASLITEYSDVFVSPDGKVGQTDLVEHYIDTGDWKPFKLPIKRIPIFKRAAVEVEVDKMLNQNIIEESNSPYNNPMCLVPKKDGSIRFCVDLRELKSRSRLDAYPHPRADETLELLSSAKYFHTLDCAQGYWQIRLNELDRPKTAFE